MSGYECFAELCNKNNLTPSKVSKLSGVPTSALTSWKYGRYRMKFDRIIALSKVLGCSYKDLIEEEPPQEYIYSLTNKYNGKKYVGVSADPLGRFKQHMQQLRRGKHHNRSMQSDYTLLNCFDNDVFAFSVIAVCGRKGIDSEKEWIEKFKTYDPEYGYNDKDSRFRYYAKSKPKKG